jgi:DNA-binding beta-propeller fold protein YncE
LLTAGFADGTGTNAQFDFPYGVAVAPNGTIYVADWFNHRIRKIS